ncbi:MAG: menaquinone-dependent protoporphyrinogen IX dehydrogenase [Flavobacteriaceae bacterium]|nr:menaquinone-dependent protoporphyrinogen IX dehydrogenase [Flavobacteriaceae bacterium]
MEKIVLLYHTTDGHTIEICEAIKNEIDTAKNEITIVSLISQPDFDITPFDKVVIGASIRYGYHDKSVFKFIKKNKELLDQKKNAFFSVNVVARKPEKNTAETNPYLQKFLSQITWKPKLLDVFAGKIEYPKYGFFDRFMIQLIMRMTKGPTDKTQTYEFTDWNRVKAFGKKINEL